MAYSDVPACNGQIRRFRTSYLQCMSPESFRTCKLNGLSFSFIGLELRVRARPCLPFVLLLAPVGRSINHNISSPAKYCITVREQPWLAEMCPRRSAETFSNYYSVWKSAQNKHIYCTWPID